MTISVTIITKNEEHNIEECLKSVQWADEIIVVDSQSTDKTVAICKQYTDKVFVMDWAGCGPQKQRALLRATSDWVLALDADERVSPELKEQILEAISPNSLHAVTNNSATEFAGFEIRFRSTYCGKLIRFGDWGNDRQAVLFRRSKTHFTTDIIHSSIVIDGKIGKLSGYIYHHPFRTLDAVIKKMNDYSSASAIRKQQHQETAGLATAIGHGLWAFIRGYIIKLGFLDGKEGFLLAVSNAEGTYYRYLKLMYLNQNASKNNVVANFQEASVNKEAVVKDACIK